MHEYPTTALFWGQFQTLENEKYVGVFNPANGQELATVPMASQ